MRKYIILILLSTLLCISSGAQDSNLLSMVSPKLRRFLADHPAISKLLADAISEAFSDRKARLYYFYSDDESVPRAYHSYPDRSTVSITIRENQRPSDECIALIFEVLNSEGEKHFKVLMKQAQARAISKADFVMEIMRVEFRAVMKTRDLLSKFKLSKKEIAESHYYKRFTQCPSDFEGYLTYKRKVAPNGRDQAKEYEQLYDSILEDKKYKESTDGN